MGCMELVWWISGADFDGFFRGEKLQQNTVGIRSFYFSNVWEFGRFFFEDGLRFLLDVMTLCSFVWLRGGFHSWRSRMRMDLDVEYIVYVVVETFFFSELYPDHTKIRYAKYQKGQSGFFSISTELCCFWPTCSWIEFAHMYSPSFWGTTTTTTTTTNNKQQQREELGHFSTFQCQGINLTGPGYVFLTNEDTAGASYQEYSIKPLGRDGGNTVLLQHFAQRVAFRGNGQCFTSIHSRAMFQNWEDFWNFRKNVTSIQGNLHLGDETSEKMVRKCSIDRWLWLVFW